MATNDNTPNWWEADWAADDVIAYNGPITMASSSSHSHQVYPTTTYPSSASHTHGFVSPNTNTPTILNGLPPYGISTTFTTSSANIDLCPTGHIFDPERVEFNEGNPFGYCQTCQERILLASLEGVALFAIRERVGDIAAKDDVSDDVKELIILRKAIEKQREILLESEALMEIAVQMVEQRLAGAKAT